MSARGRPKRAAKAPRRLQEAAPAQPARKRQKCAERPGATPASVGEHQAEAEESGGECGLEPQWWDEEQSPTETAPTPATAQLPGSMKKHTAPPNTGPKDELIATLMARIDALEKREADRDYSNKGRVLDDLRIAVPADLKDKIVSSKFVDMSRLLRKTFKTTPEEKAVMMVWDSEDRLVAKDTKTEKKRKLSCQLTSGPQPSMCTRVSTHMLTLMQTRAC